MAIFTRDWGENTGNDYAGVTDDDLLVESLPNNNFGAVANVSTRQGAGVDQRGLIRIDFSALSGLITDEQAIVSAGLYLKVSNLPDGASNASIYRIRKDWLPEGVKSNAAATAGEPCWNYEEYNTVSWQTAGAQGSADINTTPSASFGVTGSAEYIHFDITQYVKDVIRGVYPDYGFLAWCTNNTRIAYKAQNGTDGERPLLRVTFASGGVVFDDSVSGGTLFADSASASIDFVNSISDGLELSDNNTGSGIEVTKTGFDGMILSDVPDGSGVEFTKQASSGFEMSEVVDDILTYPVTAGDRLELSDSDSFSWQFDPSISDGLKFSETLSSSADFVNSVSDGIKLSDSSSFIQAIVEAINDGINFSDSGTVGLIIDKSVSDGITFSEGLSALNNIFNPSASDGVVFTDFASVGFNEFVSDGFTLNASASFNQTVYAESIADGFLMIETGTIGVKITSGAGFDGLKLGDSSISNIDTDDSASDILLLSDSDIGNVDFAVSASDGLETSDSNTALVDYVNIIGDGFDLSDDAAPGIIELLQAVDSFIMSESLGTSANYNISLSDGAVFSDPAGATFAGVAITINGKQITLTFVGRREK